AIFSSLGWSTAILRAERASARTECPASRAAFTVSRPIPLLAPMIRTVATAHAPGRPACLAVMCAAGSCAARWAGGLNFISRRLPFGKSRPPVATQVATLPRLQWETSVGLSAAAPMAALPLLLKLTVPTGLDQLYNPKRRGSRGWISLSAQSPATEVGH